MRRLERRTKYLLRHNPIVILNRVALSADVIAILLTVNSSNPRCNKPMMDRVQTKRKLFPKARDVVDKELPHHAERDTAYARNIVSSPCMSIRTMTAEQIHE